MSDQEDLKLVFTGSMVEANFIKSILDENGIEYMDRDSLSESMHAGWASGTLSSSNMIFVAAHHEKEAKLLIEEFLNSGTSKP